MILNGDWYYYKEAEKREIKNPVEKTINKFSERDKRQILGSAEKLNDFKNGAEIESIFNGVRPRYPIQRYDKALGYNGGMNKISDSGREKRYNKLLSIKDDELESIVNNAKKHQFTRSYKPLEYGKFKGFATKILEDTGNYKEKAIIFNSENNIIFEKLGFASSVSFTSDELKKLKGKYLIHNHPSSMTLSEDDVRLALDHGLKEIVAFGGKGSYYRLVVKENQDNKKIMLKYYQAKEKVISILYRFFTDGKITESQIEQEYQHLVMALFSNTTKEISYENTKY